MSRWLNEQIIVILVSYLLCAKVYLALRMFICKHTFNNRCTLFRFMVGCGRCDDWFHGDCVGLDLTKVREMEEEDQMYVCLKCCEEESRKVEPEPLSAAKPEVQVKTEIQDVKPTPKPRPGPSQTLTSGGVRPVRKVSSVTINSLRNLFDNAFKKFQLFIYKGYFICSCS